MAGILNRFKDIMSSNINALLDKAEDPEKMVDQYLRNMESDLGKVKAETAAVMAEETRRKRELSECESEIEKMQTYAKKALEAGNEADARAFLEKKSSLAKEQELLMQSYTVAAENAEKMRNMYEKLTKDIATLQSRKNEIKIKTKLAKTQTKISQMGGTSSIHGTMSAFDRMEEKANRMLDEANAMRELEESSSKDDIADLMDKYESEPSNSDVDDELAALKAELNKE
jgi:phage shock protein A